MTEWSCAKVQIQPWIFCCSSLLAAQARPRRYQSLLRSSSGSHFHTRLSPLRNWWPFHPPHSHLPLQLNGIAVTASVHLWRTPSRLSAALKEEKKKSASAQLIFWKRRLLLSFASLMLPVFLRAPPDRRWMLVSRRKHKDTEPILWDEKWVLFTC